ncbi:MAG: DNA-binding protein [Clostridia bacterium]|nr:DNA-binding protein [Clostridia bacterium]
MKDMKYSRLFDIYSGLLTDNQKEVFECYYSFDLSLSEIAEERMVTRQSVADSLKKTRLELDGFEDKLGFAAKLDKLNAYSETLSERERAELISILEK